MALLSELLAVSTGLRMQYRWFDRLPGRCLVHANGRSALLLCITFMNFILVAGTMCTTLLSTFRFVCRTGIISGNGRDSWTFAAAVTGAAIRALLMWMACAVLQSSSAISLLMRW